MNTRLHTRTARRLVALALAFLPAAGLTLVAAPAQASTTWYWFSNLDRDSLWDAAARDNDNDSRYDEFWFDLDNDGRLDCYVRDANRLDGVIAYSWFDMNENGYAETVVREGYDVWMPTRQVERWDDRGHFVFGQGYGYVTIGTPTSGGLAGLLNTMAAYSGTWAR